MQGSADSLDKSLMDRVLAFFEAGLDTAEIASRLCQHESRIERLLHIAMAKRKSTPKQ